MSRDKTRSQAKVRNVADGEITLRHKNISHKNKYHYAPQSVRQKRADEWADIEAMENRERKELDAQQYREYMDAQAEKAGWIEDRQNGLFLFYSFFIFIMGYVWALPQIRGSILVFILSSFGAYYTLQLCGGSSLTPRGKGNKR